MKKKSLSAKKKIHKTLFKHLKNKRINKVFKEFHDFLDTYLDELDEDGVSYFYFKSNPIFFNTPRLGLAISGGPDSWALAFLSKCYLLKRKLKGKFFIVDHKLRKESSTEAKSIKKLLKKFDINCEILEWKGNKPFSNVQAVARNNRYQLLKIACKKNNINNLLTGHHKYDLYENFFIRMLRGSGLKGLVSFAEPCSKLENNLKILRPFIKVEKKELIYISKTVFNFFVKDPSNENLDFLRIRIRKLILELEKEGLDTKKFDLTIDNLKSSDFDVKIYVHKNIENNATFVKNKCILSRDFFFEQGSEVVFRSFYEVLKKVSGKYYPPRGTKIKDAISKCMFSNYKGKSEINSKKEGDLKFTLGGCYIERINQTVIISKEK